MVTTLLTIIVALHQNDPGCQHSGRHSADQLTASTQTPRRQWEEWSRETGTDAGLLTQIHTSLLPHFNSTTHTVLTATCETTAFPYSGVIQK